MSVEVIELGVRLGRRTVLEGIHAVAARGRVTVVIGPNAAGKTTLLRTLVGVVRPRRGRVEVDGRPAARLTGRHRAERIAYVAQRPTVSAAFTVAEVVALGRYALTPDASAVAATLERFELTTLVDRPFPALSAGQQQRVAVARAVAQIGGPDARASQEGPSRTLVLDEPTSAMDLRHAATCLGVLRALADQGATIIVALHDIARAAAVGDDAWLLDSGRLVAAGPAQEVLTPERLESVFKVPFQWATTSDGRRQLIAGPTTSR